jgi:hypothetical protein
VDVSKTLSFRKSSYSGNDSNCVEVAFSPTGASIRDSKHPDNGCLQLGMDSFYAFVSAIKAYR